MLTNLCLAQSAQIALLKGKAYFKAPRKKAVFLKQGQLIKGNGLIKTGKKSYLKLILSGEGVLNIGANTSMAISHVNPEKPKLIELLHGKLRGYMNPKSSPKKGYTNKLIIKTRSAALGVRGTDFVVVYNNKNHITSNITLKGIVKLYKLPDEEIYDSLREEFDEGGKRIEYNQDAISLEQNLNHYKTESIPKSHFSGAFPSYEKVISPVKISPLQYNALKGNQNLKHGRSLKLNESLKNNYSVSMNSKGDNNLVPSPRGEEKLESGRYNTVKNSDGVRHGGHLDLNTGIYIAPPKSSTFDTRTQSYLMPDNLGGIHPDSGEYVPPDGLILDPLNGFTLDPELPKKRNISENLAKIKNLTGPFNKQLAEALDIFKEITRLDVHSFANYNYVTNVIENYYGEFRRVTNDPSMVWDLRGSAGFQLFHNKEWLIYPKGSLRARYYERALPQIKEQNQYTGTLGAEVHHKHQLFGRKARLITEFLFTTRYMDYRRRNLLDFYTEDVGLKLTERFSLNRSHHLGISYRARAYQGFRDNDHGNIHDFMGNLESELGPTWSLLTGVLFSYRRDKIDNQKYQVLGGHLKFKWKEILSKSDLTFGYSYQHHNTRVPTIFSSSRYYKLDLLLHRRLGHFWKLNFLYEFDRQRAEDNFTERRSFIRQSYGAGLTMVF